MNRRNVLKEARQKVLITAETNKLWSCGADSSQRKPRGKYLDLLIYEELSQWDEFGCTELSTESRVCSGVNVETICWRWGNTLGTSIYFDSVNITKEEKDWFMDWGGTRVKNKLKEIQADSLIGWAVLPCETATWGAVWHFFLWIP